MSYYDDDVVATSDDGTLRVILEHDADCERPMDSTDAWTTSVLTLTGSARWTGSPTMEAEYDPENRLAVWQDFNTYRQVPDADAAFILYMRIFHDIDVVETGFGSDGTRALAWIEQSERERVGIPDTYPSKDAIDIEIAEHNTWARGECYGYRVQRLTTWRIVSDDPFDTELAERQTWEDTDATCWGFIGREYAEQEATEALAGFRD